ncbi:MAG: HD domain-containing protein [candidate division KSB1 bacterium]|nr:HD domain-containing protein [candidate division KSB1 bacterium]MDZ7375762.1 HD domain-containing protein [candidate division KSB1 bacterium]
MKQDLLKILPEFNLIKDEELRNKTVAVWEDAIKIGGWKVADLEEIPFTLLIANCPINIVDHTRGVTQVAIAAAQKLRQFNNNSYEIDDDILISGGLLHDVGKILEYKHTPEGVKKSDTGKLLRHPFSGAGLAMKHGLPDKVVHIIAVHAKEGDGGYRCPEAVIVHHADFMNFEPIKG